MDFESKITFEIPTNIDFDSLIQSNYTLLFNKVQMSDPLNGLSNSDMNKNFIGKLNSDMMNKDYNLPQSFSDPNYERFIGDVWVGIVLTLMILSTIFCMCSCYLYHKFRQWKNSVLSARAAHTHAEQTHYDVDSLPSYTIVSGLPSYNDALEQFKKIRQNNDHAKVHRPSVIKLFSSSSTMGSDQLDGLQEIKYNFNQIQKNPYAVPLSYIKTKDEQYFNKHLMAAPSYEDETAFGEASSTVITIQEEHLQSVSNNLRTPPSILFEDEKQLVKNS